MTKFIILDYETRSELALKEFGAYEYAKHPSTRIMCASIRVGTRQELAEQIENSKRWRKQNPDKPFYANPFRPRYFFGIKDFGGFDFVQPLSELKKYLAESGRTLLAHNATFEQLITRFVLQLETEIDRWACTATFAAALALPRNLEGACAALGLDIQKDMTGNRLVKKYCKPRKASKNNPDKYFSDRNEIQRIIEYCGNDVDAETELFLKVPPLNNTERKIWKLDQKINFKGVRVDRETVGKTLTMIDQESRNLIRETQTITKGAVKSPRQIAELSRWVHRQGATLFNLQAKTISDFLEVSPETDVTKVLRIRQAISKTSTAKYEALEKRSRTDGRIRDLLLYHAASTGRWGGKGFQPQNLPRGVKGISSIHATEYLKTGDLELVRFLFGSPMDVFSTCIRSMLQSSEGRLFYCADFNAIEARVLFWLAGHRKGIEAFLKDLDQYVDLAVDIYGLSHISAVTEWQRDLGKRAFLGCGYGMGWKKFKMTCTQWGQPVEDEIAQTAVSVYREKHYLVPLLWKNYERAAIHAVLHPRKIFSINKTKWFVKDNFLFCELPSGRRLAYYGPKIKYEKTPWGEPAPKLYHWGVDSYTHKWVFSSTYGGALTENVTQAIARDLMAEAMLRIDSAGFDIVLSVHDELLTENKPGKDIKAFEALMSELPAWAAGCPVKSKGWSGERYRK